MTPSPVDARPRRWLAPARRPRSGPARRPSAERSDRVRAVMSAEDAFAATIPPMTSGAAPAAPPQELPERLPDKLPDGSTPDPELVMPDAMATLKAASPHRPRRVRGRGQRAAAAADRAGVELPRGARDRPRRHGPDRRRRGSAARPRRGAQGAPEPAGEQLSRFQREALITARLQHPGIVPVYEAGRWPTGEPFFAMKLVAGQPRSRDRRDQLARRSARAPAADRRRRRRDRLRAQLACGPPGPQARERPDRRFRRDRGSTGASPRISTTATACPRSPPRSPRCPAGLVAKKSTIYGRPGATAGGDADRGRRVVMGTPAYMAPEQSNT